MTDHTSLEVHEYGDPGAPVLVVLHGITDSGRCWGDLVARMGDRYRVVAPDALGHGGSARFTPEQLEGDAVEPICAALESLLVRLVAEQGTPVLVMGHSMGGGLAAALGARRPDLVRALVLEDPAWLDLPLPGPDAPQTRERVADAEATTADPEAAIATCRVDHPTWPEVELGPWARAKAECDLAFLRTGQAVVRTPWPEVAAALTVPTLVVTGDGEVLLHAEVRDRIAALGNPALEVRVVEGAGHCVRRDRGEAFHALVEPWLAHQN